MVYLILAGLVLALILAVNIIKAEPMPESMEEEDERLDRQEQAALRVQWWEVQAGYKPKALSDRLGALTGKAEAARYPKGS